MQPLVNRRALNRQYVCFDQSEEVITSLLSVT